ncbi:MAG: homoserine dehydrogenase [Deltaproteobacteria bacterium]|jgi:homoserine dehydrogenase|nr:homoserine dehydrogenase [Deltaproteobacteria bacterium]
MAKTVQVGILGFGTVGGGTAKLLLEQRELLRQRTGVDIKLSYICDRNISDSRGFSVPNEILTTDLNQLLTDPDLDIFVELIGGIEPARTFILKAIQHGKHVVTANKALISTHGDEIFAEAEKYGVTVGFEASVGGGVPVIKALREGLAANNFHAVMGIMNGTANYILSRMTDEGADFESVLKDAQRLGYAEADPTYDVEGIDTAHKLAILTKLAFGVRVTPDDIYTEGISRLSPIDIQFAAELGYTIKLLAIARSTDAGLDLRVHPTMIPSEHLLAQVKEAYNAFYLIGDAVGKVLMYGLGAGRMPTGSAVVADILDIARAVSAGAVSSLPRLPAHSLAPLQKRPVETVSGRYYCRFSAMDRPGVLARIAGILAENHISIASVVQKGRGDTESVPIVMLTHEAEEASVQRALGAIDAMDMMAGNAVVIRMEDLSSY